jgi:hypothetical protein
MRTHGESDANELEYPVGHNETDKISLKDAVTRKHYKAAAAKLDEAEKLLRPHNPDLADQVVELEINVLELL